MIRVLIDLPHRVCESTCFSNGLEDLVAWRGADYMPYLLPVLGGASGFAYLNFKRASPPCMVYWGPNTKYFMRDLAGLIGFQETVLEGRSFSFMFERLKHSIEGGQPVIAGALDMYYLPYYRTLYGKLHVPIHYVLVVGYSDEEQQVYVHDCTHRGVQKIPYTEFEKSLNVNVPGMSKKNTIRMIDFSGKLPSELEIAQKGFASKAERFLKPPVAMFGVTAMRKLSKEILAWDNRACFEHMVTYATVPPHIPKTFEQSHGLRFWQAQVLEQLGKKYSKEKWVEAAEKFRQSGEVIKQLCASALAMDKQAVSADLLRVASYEEAGYLLILLQ
jgi:hypothetical protein